MALSGSQLKGEDMKRNPRPRKNTPEYYRWQYRAKMLPGVALFSFTKVELEALDLALFYQQLRREKSDNPFYTALPTKTDPRKSQNWKHFQKALCLVKENHYIIRDFIVAQFEELESWDRHPLPTPKNLCVEGAVDRYDCWRLKEKKKKLDESKPATHKEKKRWKDDNQNYVRKQILRSNGSRVVRQWMRKI